jgi:hypothetical protein
MARRLKQFPGEALKSQRRYPWTEWIDGSAWEIRRGDDYDVATENMRVNLHLKADAVGRKVRTKKVSDGEGEALAFQFIPSEEEELVRMGKSDNPKGTAEALQCLYEDAVAIYEQAREEVLIPRKDGSQQKYAAVRFKQQIDKGQEEGTIVPTVARIVRRPTKGFGHLKRAGRDDLMLESLVIDGQKPYHRFFSKETIRVSVERMAEAREPRFRLKSSEGEVERFSSSPSPRSGAVGTAVWNE